MSEAPERIWAWRESPNDSGSWDEAGCRTKFPDDVEYVRADMAPSPEVLAQVENDAWLAAISVVAERRNSLEPGRDFKLLNELMGEMDEARRTAIKKDTPLGEKIGKENEK